MHYHLGVLAEEHRSARLISEELQRTQRRYRWYAAIAFAVATGLAIAYACTRSPWWDEGVFSDVAINFRNNAHLRSSLLAPDSYLNIPAPDRFTYWQFPGYLVALGVWLGVLPVSIYSVRLFSIVWGGVFVGSWFVFVRAISRNESLALLAAVLVAFDYSVVAAASDGRMDMMCAALGLAALAFYAAWRENDRLWTAVMVGVCGAGCLLSHPMGLVMNAVLLAVVLCDRGRLRGRFVAAALLPYVVFGGAWLIYIAQDPALFVAQMKANAGYRVGGVMATLQSVARDLPDRYLQFYFAPEGGWHRLKVAIPLFGLTGLAMLVANPRERRTALVRRLVVMLVVAFLGVAALDNRKFPYYLVYVIPVLAVLGGVWVYQSVNAGTRARWVALFLAAAFVGANAADIAYHIRRNDFAREYRPAVAEIQKRKSPGAIVMGPSELGYALGFQRPLIDDCYLGRVSGIRPQLYILHSSCGPMQGTEAAWAWTERQLGESYREVYRNPAYTIYERKASTE